MSHFAGSHYLPPEAYFYNPSPGDLIFGISDTFEDTVHDDLVVVVVMVIVIVVSLVVFPFPFIAFPDSCSPTLNCLLDHSTNYDTSRPVRETIVVSFNIISLPESESKPLVPSIGFQLLGSIHGHHSFHVVSGDLIE
ncbi:hypothetical protein Tco_1547559 [Tanacetum coccineum]